MAVARIFCVFAMLLLAACFGDTNEVGRDLVVGEIRADSVVVDDLSKVRMMGIVLYSAGNENSETGKMELTTGAPRPTGPGGPVTVYIFRRISPSAREHMDRERVDAQENTAYLIRHEAKLGMNEFRKMKEIGPIDPTLSDHELGALFGLSME